MGPNKRSKVSEISTADNPFGSFRHNGSFPSSLFDEYSSSDDSYQMTAHVNSPSSTFEDSTHIYMNNLEQSFSLNKYDSVLTEPGSTDDKESNLSYLLSTIQRSWSHDVLNVTSESCDSDLDLPLGPRPPCVGREDTQLEHTDVKLTTKSSMTFIKSATDPYTTSQATYTRGRRSHIKQMHSDCQQLVDDINVNIHQWLNRLTSPRLASTNHRLAITKPSSNQPQSCQTDNKTDYSLIMSFRKSCVTSTAVNVVDISPIKKRTSIEVVDSGVDSDYSDGSGSDSSCESDFSTTESRLHNNQLPPDSIIGCSKSDICHSHTTNCSIDSDTSTFLQQLFVNQPVTGNKISGSKKANFLKCLKKLGKLMKHKATSKSSAQ